MFALPLMRFHLRVGVRVAVRSLVPLAVAAVAASVLYGSPMAVLGPVRALLLPPTPSAAAALLAMGLCVGIAAASGPRLTVGVTGWLRHLPVPSAAHRRAVTAGLVVVQAPFLAIVAAGGLGTLDLQADTTVPRLVGLGPLAWVSALASLRVVRRSTRPMAIVAAVMAWVGSWPWLLGSLLCLIAVELTAGALAGRPRSRKRRRRLIFAPSSSRGWGDRAAAAGLWLAIAWRALGWRIGASWIPGLLVLFVLEMFLRNNSLTQEQRLLAVRFAGVVGTALVMSALADGLVRLRPPWPWIRSLPWSCARRTAIDAGILAGVALPVAAIAGAFVPAVLPTVAATLPLLALRGATAVRRGPGRASGASGPLLVEGSLAAAAVAVVPWSAAVAVALVPLAARLAANSEREQEISRWHELHHMAAGDPLSWSSE